MSYVNWISQNSTPRTSFVAWPQLDLVFSRCARPSLCRRQAGTATPWPWRGKPALGAPKAAAQSDAEPEHDARGACNTERMRGLFYAPCSAQEYAWSSMQAQERSRENPGHSWSARLSWCPTGRNAVRSSSFEAAGRAGRTEEGLGSLASWELSACDHDQELCCAPASILEVMLKHTFLDPAAWPPHGTLELEHQLRLEVAQPSSGLPRIMFCLSLAEDRPGICSLGPSRAL